MTVERASTGGTEAGDWESDPAPDTPLEDPRPPETHEEEVIAGIWAELLGMPNPPANVSFFELGGYSLALMRVAARLQQAFGLTVPVDALFECLTVSAQAELVERLYNERLAEFAD